MLQAANSTSLGRDERIRFILRSAQDPLADDGPNVILNLTHRPKRISPVYVYDRTGTELFERQCETPEYYLRRAEARLLQAHAEEILTHCSFPPIVELGAGTAHKTRILLAHYERRGIACDYCPIDVDAETLLQAAHGLIRDHRAIRVHCLSATFEEGLRALPATAQNRLFLFLGGSLGNMEIAEIERLLAQMHAYSARGDTLLIGADLHKDPSIITRAYNDAAGWGARSSLNMLSHLNWRYGGDFDIDRFAYRSSYNVAIHCNEVRLESLVAQTVKLQKLDLRVDFARSELIDAEIMWKFDPAELVQLLENAGFAWIKDWIEPFYRYGIFLLRRE